MTQMTRSFAARSGRRFSFLAAAVCAAALPALAAAQDPAELEVSPPTLTLEVGKTAQLSAVVRDSSGREIERGVVFFSRARRHVGVNPAGLVEAHRPGEHTVVAMVPRDPDAMDRRAEMALMVEITVTVPLPPLERIEVGALPGMLYAGTSLPVSALAHDVSGAERRPDFAWESSDPAVATVKRTRGADAPGRGQGHPLGERRRGPG